MALSTLRNLAIGICATALLTVGAQAVTIIYQDDFSTSGALNGSTPDVGASNWTSSTLFTSDGSVASRTASSSSQASATLPFTVVAGNIYELRATLSVTATSGSGSRWISLGFFDSTLATNENSPQQDNGPWMLLRYDLGSVSGTDPNTIVFFSSTSASAVNFDETADGRTNVDVLLTLDTTGTLWTVGMEVDGTVFDLNGVGAGTLFQYTTNPTIALVGFNTTANTAVNVDNFSLVAVPEPSGPWLAALGAGGLVLRRRRR
jgi:hypothetical protein